MIDRQTVQVQPRSAAPLTATTILVVEDEPFIALDLAASIEDAGGAVLGPVATVTEALRLLQSGVTVDGAILDVNLLDGDVEPVLRRLLLRKAVVVLHTAVGLPANVSPEEAGDVRVFAKPTAPERLVREISRRLRRSTPPETAV